LTSQNEDATSGRRPSLHGTIEQQVQLPLRKALEIAWRNIRVRLVRSLLVTSGIILALAFLTYILCSDSLTRSFVENGPPKIKQRLENEGALSRVSDETAKSQTRWLVGLALLVSFVGILNAMLLSVTERFQEIGTMKCLGALDGLIVELFLLESTFQGIVGTAIGIVIGVVLALAEATVVFGPSVLGRDVLPALEMLKWVGICLLTGTALTVVGALYPAWRAARMQPVDAMRSEV